jgi:hypothetical protein
MIELVSRFLGRALGRAEDGPGRGAYRTVVRRLAESLQREERVAGGWATEVGVLPPAAFEPDAERMVRAIAVGGDRAGPPTP